MTQDMAIHLSFFTKFEYLPLGVRDIAALTQKDALAVKKAMCVGWRGLNRHVLISEPPSRLAHRKREIRTWRGGVEMR